MACTYTLKGIDGNTITIEGIENFQAWLVDGGLEHLYPDVKFPWDIKFSKKDGLADAKKEGYEGNDTGEAEEWLRAKAKGLDMSKSARMERAKAMGFDVNNVYYHGTNKDIKSFNNFVSWFTKDAKFASEYADLRDVQSGGGGNVMPVYLRHDSPFNADHLSKGSNKVNEFVTELAGQSEVDYNDKEILELLRAIQAGAKEEESGPYYSNFDFWYNPYGLFGEKGANSISKLFEKLGYDSINFTEDGTPTVGIINKNQIRSIHAAFDPDYADSPNLLASKSQKKSNTHTIESLKTEFTKQLDSAYGEGWSSRLFSTGKFEVIDREQAAKLVGSDTVDYDGFYNPSDDTTYFVADNIGKDDDLKALALHEIAVHQLQLNRNDKEFKSILDQVDKLYKSGNKAVVEAFNRVPEDTKKEHVTEEILAYLVQDGSKLSVVERFKAWLKQKIGDMRSYFTGKNKYLWSKWVNSLNEKDLVYMAENALRSAPDSLMFDGNSEGGVRFSFAGKNAKTADKYALSTAQERLAKGDDPEQVRKDTGWFKGTDGKYRFEIDDSEARLKPAIKSLSSIEENAKPIKKVSYRKNDDGTYTLSLVPENPQKVSDIVDIRSISRSVLKSILPSNVIQSIDKNEGEDDYVGDFEEAKEINADFDFEGFNALPLGDVLDHPALFAAYPDVKNVLLQVDRKLGNGGSFNYSSDGSKVIRVGAGQQLSTMLHEIQHAIQENEGFAKGGSPESMSSDIKALKELNDIPYAEMDDFQQYMYKELKSKYGNSKTEFEAYKRLSGETEARNTQARQKLTTEDRRNTSPKDTQDVKDEDQIIVWNSKEMRSISEDSFNRPLPLLTSITPETILNEIDEKLVPYVNAEAARQAIKLKGLSDTHEVVVLDARDKGKKVIGYAIEPIKERQNNDVQRDLETMRDQGKLDTAMDEDLPYTVDKALETDASVPREVWNKKTKQQLLNEKLADKRAAKEQREINKANKKAGIDTSFKFNNPSRPSNNRSSTRSQVRAEVIDNETGEIISSGGGSITPPFDQTNVMQSIRDWAKPPKGAKPLNALGGLFPRNALIDFANDLMPNSSALRNYKRMTQEKENLVAKKEQEVGDRYNQYRDKLNSKDAAEMARVQGLATLLDDFDPANPPIETDSRKWTKEEKDVLAEYEALSDNAKEVYQQMRDDYKADLLSTQNALIDNINESDFSDDIKQSNIKKIQDHFDQFTKKGVYFPLSRFGDTVVTAKDRNGNKVVEFVDGQKAAQRLMDEMKAQGYTERTTSQKDVYIASEAQKNAASEAVKIANDILDAVGNKELSGNEKDELHQLLLQAIPDVSYRKHFIHRKGISGYSQDALRGYAHTRVAAAKHIASISYDNKIAGSLAQAGKDAKALKKDTEGNIIEDADTSAIDSILNELKLREDALRTMNISPIANTLTQLGFMGAMGFSIASAAVNVMQVPGVTFPELSGKFGAKKAFDSLNTAYGKLLNPKVLSAKSGFDLLKNPKLTRNERMALESLAAAGKINLDQTHDAIGYGQKASFSDNKFTKAIETTAKWSGYLFHVTEGLNRQITGLAAFNLEFEKNGGDFEKALNATMETIDKTQFDYTASNRARYMMGNTARVLTLFKTYAIGMSYYIGRNAYNAIKAESPEERLAARKAIAVQMFMTFATSGLFGLPIFAEAVAGIGGVAAFRYAGSSAAVPGAVLGLVLFQSLLAGMGADDDDDLEVEFRNWLTDHFNSTVAECVTKGPMRLIPLGDLSGRTGLSSIWWNKENKQAEGKEKYQQIVNSLLGPVASQAAGMFTAANYMADGQAHRAVEAMSPRFLANLLASERMAMEGVRNVKGDKIVDRDLTWAEIANKAIGFNPTVVSNTYDATSAITKERAKIAMKKSHLVNRYMDADPQERNELFNNEIKKFNQDKPASEHITKKTLLKSMRQRKAANKQTVNGLRLSGKQEYLRDIGRFNQ